MDTIPDYEVDAVSNLSMCADLLDRALTVFDAAQAHPILLEKGDSVLLSTSVRFSANAAERVAKDFKQRFGVNAVLLDGAQPVAVQKAKPQPDMQALAVDVAEIKGFVNQLKPLLPLLARFA